MLLVPIITGTQYTGADLRGRYSRKGAAGIIPLVRPVAEDLVAALSQLAARVGLKQVDPCAGLLIAELAEGNYQLFVHAILTACGVIDREQQTLPKGSHTACDKRLCTSLFIYLATQPLAHCSLVAVNLMKVNHAAQQ